VLYLRENKIGCRAVYDSLCNQPYHSQWKTPTPVTELLSSRGVHLPAQADLNADDIKYISDIIKDYVA
jgi:dTDP-4-amino-4,6-dideoxygalactose transaminase